MGLLRVGKSFAEVQLGCSKEPRECQGTFVGVFGSFWEFFGSFGEFRGVFIKFWGVF